MGGPDPLMELDILDSSPGGLIPIAEDLLQQEDSFCQLEQSNALTRMDSFVKLGKHFDFNKV